MPSHPGSDNPTDNLLEILMHAGREIAATGTEDLYRLYELLHRTAARIAPVDAFYVCLYSEEDQTLFFSYHFDDHAYDVPLTLPLGAGPTSWVVRNSRPFVLTRENEETHRGGVGFGDAERRSRSAVHVPMRIVEPGGAERVLGVLSAQSYAPDVYDARFVQALQWLADGAGMLLLREQETAAWRGYVQAADARAAEYKRQMGAVASAAVQVLKQLTGEAEALRSLPPGDDAARRAAIERLCRAGYRAQTEISHLPLRLGQQAPPAPSETAAGAEPPGSLTEREREILRLLAAGESYASIAEQLYVSLHTVKFHCGNLYRKLGARNRHQAVQKGRALLSAPGET